MLNQSDTRDDPITPIAQAGINFVFSTDGVVLRMSNPRLITVLDRKFIKAGYGI